MPSTQAPRRGRAILCRNVFQRAATVAVVALLFGWVYAWAAPHAFPKDVTAGPGYGFAHGALMPLALPSLVIGKDVEIFASNNSGRGYKLGYIAGINLCGLVFFGSAFWRPAKTQSHAGPSAASA
jgi:hypothetical protein